MLEAGGVTVIVLKPWQKKKQMDFPAPPSCSLFKNTTELVSLSWWDMRKTHTHTHIHPQMSVWRMLFTHTLNNTISQFAQLPAVSRQAVGPAVKKRSQTGIMNRQLELAALGLAFTGWLCATITRCQALWTVSGTLDNTTATLPAYWDGVWLEWNHWDLAHDGSLHCSFYQALMTLSGSFRTWKALINAAIGAGAFAIAICGVGTVWFPTRGQVKVFSGVLFVLSGFVLLVPIAWTCHHSGQPLEGAVLLRRDWGPALYLGWISIVLMVVGGVYLTTRWPTVDRQPQQPTEGSYPTMEDESSHPLSRIHRTVFTSSQYERSQAVWENKVGVKVLDKLKLQVKHFMLKQDKTETELQKAFN